VKLVQQRFVDTGKSTTSTLHTNNEFLCFILEDTYRHEKVAGKTRIPAGTYEIVFRKEISPDTTKRRMDVRMKDWFEWHLMLVDVPGFEYIYSHEGNRAEDTRGCLLPGMTSNPHGDFTGNSVIAMEMLYKMIGIVLDSGERVFIEIRDEHQLGGE